MALNKPDLQKKLSAQFKVSPIIAQILINRGLDNVQDAKAYLEKDIDSLYDPFLLPDMKESAKRVLSAVKEKELITIYGDYDADGICATALLFLTLQEMGAKCGYYLPHRIDEGYGLNKEAIEKCRDIGTKLLITVDCGISGKDEINYAKSLGMDVIVTDHHLPTSDIPECVGVINPKINGSKYPYKELAGVGVAYKLAEAITKTSKKINVKKHLDLVAVGTVADIVPLTGENRILVHHGLKTLDSTQKIGLTKLKEKGGIKIAVEAIHIAFRIAPRLNAAGRLATAESAIKLLLTKDNAEATQLCNELDANNRERQKIEEEVLDSAIAQMDLNFDFNDDRVIVLHNKEWPAGVIGIVAGRITSRYNRPCIMISVNEGLGKGSGRSIRNFHLLNALQSCDKHLRKFGGHAHAAGLSIEELLIDPFRKKINEHAHIVLKDEDLIPTIDIDAEIDPQNIDFDLIEQLKVLEPFGHHNQRPCLAAKNFQIYREPVIVGDGHLKFWVKSGMRVFEAIGFEMAQYQSLFDDVVSVDLAFRPQINIWQNKQTLQLNVMDIKAR